MKAMRVRVPEDVAAAIAAEAVDPVTEAEVVRRALWFYLNFRHLVGSMEGPSRPLNGPASSFSDGAVTAPQRPRGAVTAPQRPRPAIGDGLILPADESQGGAVTTPQRPLDGPATRDARVDREPSPRVPLPPEASLPPAAAAAAAGAQTRTAEAYAAVRAIWAELKLGQAPHETVVGYWRREAGGIEPMLETLRELAGKGLLTRAEDAQRFVFGAMRTAGRDRARAAAAAADTGARAQSRLRLDHTRAFLHGPEEERPYHEQQLRSMSGDSGLLWEPPTEHDLERLEREVYGDQAAAGGGR